MGTVDSTDSQKLVNLMVQDPQGKLVLMTGTFAQSNDTFQIVVNTNDQSQFHVKGTYSATAFIDSKSSGKTLFFDFSPDGSPVIHTTESQNNSSSQDSTGLNHHESVLYESMKITDVLNSSQKILSARNTDQSSTYDVASILYSIMVAGGAGLIGFILYQRKKRTSDSTVQSKQTMSMNSSDDTDYAMMILKNRLAKGEITIEEFNATKDALNES